MNALANETSTTLTPKELLAMPEEKNYELVGGHLVERTMSTLSSWVAGELLFLIRTYCQTDPRGWVMPEGTGYQCYPDDPDKVRKPDVSFIRGDRLPPHPSQGYLTVAPDLAVEVLSQNDLAWDVDRKVAEYLRAGVPLVWVVHPEARAVRVHRAGGTVSWLREEDELSGEDILPGFRCRVSAIFPLWADAGTLAEDA